MKFSKVIIANLGLLDLPELLDIKEALIEAIASRSIIPEAQDIYDNEGRIPCIKFIMRMRGERLTEAKDYFNANINHLVE